MTTDETRVFDGDGVRLVASAFGDPTGPTVCFFHGGGQSRRAWLKAARLIAEAGYHTLSFDLRGHGDSGWAEDGDYALDAYARDIERLFAQLPGQLTLVGASRGGQAALVGGARHQNRLRLILLADVVPENSTSGVAGIRAFLRASIAGFATIAEAAAALSRYTGGPAPADPSRLGKALRHHDGRLFWHWDPQTVAPEFLSPPSEAASMYAAARSFHRPLVLVRAEHDSLATDEAIARFREAAPQLVVETAPGTRHMITGDDNAVFAARLLHHLAQA